MVSRVSVSALFLVFVLVGCAGMSEESSTEPPAENFTLSAAETLDCVNASGIKEAFDDLNQANEAVSSGLSLVAEYGIEEMGSVLVTAMQNSSGEIGALSSRFSNQIDDCDVEGLRNSLDEMGSALGELSVIYTRHSSLELAHESGDLDRVFELKNVVGSIAQEMYDQLLELAEASIVESETSG